MDRRHLEQHQRCLGDVPGVGRSGGLLHVRRCVGQGDRDPPVDTALQPIPLLVAAGHQEAGEGELTQQPGLSQVDLGSRRIDVGQDRARPRVYREIDPLLAGVLEGKEERLEGGATCGPQHTDQVALPGHPVGGEHLGDGPALVEVGGHQVNDFMERGGDGHLVGRHRRRHRVRRLEDPRVAHDLVGASRRFGPEPHDQLRVARESTGEPGHRRRHPLVAAHHLLDGAFLRADKLGEAGAVIQRAGRGHSRPLSHSAPPPADGPATR